MVNASSTARPSAPVSHEANVSASLWAVRRTTAEVFTGKHLE